MTSGPPTIESIQRVVAAEFGTPLIDMISERTSRDVARPRQVAMYLCRYLTPTSLPRIGRAFGGRDHTTVKHAVNVITELIRDDEGFAERVETLWFRLMPVNKPPESASDGATDDEFHE